MFFVAKSNKQFFDGFSFYFVFFFFLLLLALKVYSLFCPTRINWILLLYFNKNHFISTIKWTLNLIYITKMLFSFIFHLMTRKVMTREEKGKDKTWNNFYLSDFLSDRTKKRRILRAMESLWRCQLSLDCECRCVNGSEYIDDYDDTTFHLRDSQFSFRFFFFFSDKTLLSFLKHGKIFYSAKSLREIGKVFTCVYASLC